MRLENIAYILNKRVISDVYHKSIDHRRLCFFHVIAIAGWQRICQTNKYHIRE